ncbi:MAG: hypothetical protein DMF53_23835 [Acidobacteria bacterium]|nr:MAG: hypothetical protein DMF53_23835 [Acidobacteriota bacterium]
MIEPQQRRSPWLRIAIGLAVTLAAFAIHDFTLTRVATWQPGYPRIVVLGLFTPPSLMRQLHIFAPVVLALAFIVLAVASWRAGSSLDRPSWRSGIARSAGVALIALLVLYSWALFWVVRVSRYIPR